MPMDKHRYAKSVVGLALKDLNPTPKPRAKSAPVTPRESPEKPPKEPGSPRKQNDSSALSNSDEKELNPKETQPSKAPQTEHPTNEPPSPPKAAQSKTAPTRGRKSPQKQEAETKVPKVNKDSLGSAADAIRSKINLPNNMEWTYYLGGGNGVAIIEETLNGLGYKRLKEKTDETFRFKWVELKAQINYHAFREGEQMVNHIPNCNLLTNKLGLVNSLQEYDRMCTSVKKKPSKLDFIPETFRLDDKTDKELFFESFVEGDMWICKPTGKNQGKGIFLVRQLDELNQLIKDNEELNNRLRENNRPLRPLNRIIQRYIPNPLLLNQRKFDIRAYMLIANTSPFLVLYHKGYVRLSMHDYEQSSDNISTHLTNQYIQKRDPKYKEIKEDTAWSMDRFNDYVNEKIAPDKGLEQNWVYNTLTNKMKQIITFCFNAVKHRLQCKVGYSDLYGLDFMVDEDMKVWLIEVNVNPSLSTSCEALKEVVPPMVKETIYLCIECFEKSRRNRPLLPLQTLQNFTILYNGSSSKTSGASRATHRSITATPPTKLPSLPGAEPDPGNKRSRSLSPVKEVGDNTNSSSTRPRITNRHVLKATPTLLNPQNAKSEASSSTNRLRDKTLGAYRHASVKPLPKDLRQSRSPTQMRKFNFTERPIRLRPTKPIDTKTDNEKDSNEIERVEMHDELPSKPVVMPIKKTKISSNRGS